MSLLKMRQKEKKPMPFTKLRLTENIYLATLHPMDSSCDQSSDVKY